MRIVFLGAPGSGKGTQAKQLMAEHSMVQISTGDLLREAVAAGTELGQQAKTAMDSGALVSDEIVLGMIRARLLRDDIENGFILDGFPRNLAQAHALEDVLAGVGKPLDAAVLLEVDFGILMKRLTGRRTCSVTGELLNIHFSPESVLQACRDAGGELIQRDDDNEDTIANRLNVYREQTEPLIDYYSQKSLLRTVDGEGDMADVFKRLAACLDLKAL
jgi:adenylate kinase